METNGVNPINDYFPPNPDSLYSRRLEKYGRYALHHIISASDKLSAQQHAFVELARLLVLPRYQSCLVVIDGHDLSDVDLKNFLVLISKPG